MRSYKTLIAAALVALIYGAMPLLAQQPPAPQPSTAEGRLLKVDSTAKTITIRTPSDTEMTFVYNEDTKVTGGDDNVSGLATLSDSDVKVTYTKKGADNVASQIEVQKKPAV